MQNFWHKKLILNSIWDPFPLWPLHICVLIWFHFFLHLRFKNGCFGIFPTESFFYWKIWYFLTLFAHLFNRWVWRLPWALSWLLIHVYLGPGLGWTGEMDSKVNKIKVIKTTHFEAWFQSLNFTQQCHRILLRSSLHGSGCGLHCRSSKETSLELGRRCHCWRDAF